MSESRVPQLRFEGFDGAWATSTVGCTAKIDSGRDYKHLNAGEIPVYGTGGFMLTVDQALSYCEDAIGIGRKGTIDKPYILRAPFWTVDTLFYVTPNSETDLYFLQAIFERVDWKAKDESTGVPSLSRGAIANTEICLAERLEQEKIGALFSQLDSLIGQHRRKLKQLQQTKTALMQRMFPQGDADEPELRFEGFDGAWKRVTMGSLAHRSVGGGTPSKQRGEFWSGDLPWIQTSDLSESAVCEVKPEKHISHEAVQHSAAKIIPANSIAIVTRVGVGKVAIMKTPYATSQDFLSLVGIEGDLAFLGVAIKRVMDASKTSLQGSTIKGITNQEALRVEILVPVHEEQQQIGALFSQLDSLIGQHRRKLKQLQQTKTALLQRMFV